MNCSSQENGIFLVKDDIYLDYDSSVTKPDLRTVITYPNGNIAEVTLPAQLKASQIGTYELEVTASKPGYKTITEKELFGVIEKEPEIQYLFEKKVNYLLLGSGIAVLAILLISLIIIKKRNKPVQQTYYSRHYKRFQ